MEQVHLNPSFKVVFVVGPSNSDVCGVYSSIFTPKKGFSLPSHDQVFLERSDIISKDILKKYTNDPETDNSQFIICGSMTMEKEIINSLQQLYTITDADRIFAFSLPPKQIASPPELPVQTLVETSEPVELPRQPQPGECCGQSCPNCVWMEYVDKMKGLAEKGLIDKNRLIDLINDLDVVPAVKAFLRLEINSWR